jgi:hypothetical protein
MDSFLTHLSVYLACQITIFHQTQVYREFLMLLNFVPRIKIRFICSSDYIPQLEGAGVVSSVHLSVQWAARR